MAANIKKPGEISSTKSETVKRISPAIEQDINKHIKAESFSSNLYLAMATWFDDKGYLGGAALFRKYAEEELKHMHKLYGYVLDRNCRPITPEIPKPDNEFKSVIDILNKAYKHEIGVSESYKESADLALREKDYTAFGFFQWFIEEQIEEEAKFLNLIDKYNIIMTTGVTGLALMQFDEILGEYK